MLSHEDKKDVARVMGKSMARKVSTATNDAKSKALDKVKTGSRKFPKSKDPYGLSGLKKMFESSAHKKAVAKGKAESMSEHEFRD